MDGCRPTPEMQMELYEKDEWIGTGSVYGNIPIALINIKHIHAERSNTSNEITPTITAPALQGEN